LKRKSDSGRWRTGGRADYAARARDIADRLTDVADYLESPAAADDSDDWRRAFDLLAEKIDSMWAIVSPRPWGTVRLSRMQILTAIDRAVDGASSWPETRRATLEGFERAFGRTPTSEDLAEYFPEQYDPRAALVAIVEEWSPELAKTLRLLGDNSLLVQNAMAAWSRRGGPRARGGAPTKSDAVLKLLEKLGLGGIGWSPLMEDWAEWRVSGGRAP
jgi:hypothetical protein